MDRLVALIIVVGIFVGSVQSVLLQTSRARAAGEIGGDRGPILAEGKGGIEYGGEVETVSPPVQDESRGPLQILGQGDTATKAEGTDQAQKWDFVGMGGGVNAYVSGDDQGIMTTYPEKRVLYLGYSLVLVRLNAGQSPVGIYDALAALRAVVVDEMGESMSVLVPSDAEPQLASLVVNGTISSYELGGWGQGLGKA